MKVLVTGANGFIGKNLIVRLSEVENIEILAFDIENSDLELEQMLSQSEFIFHLAGVNRPKNEAEFYTGNSDLTSKIVEILRRNNKNTPIIFSSTIQAELENDYGKSKRMAEEKIKEHPNAYIFRLHNVFGKWCRPNYNSVVATFCHNIANNMDIKINDKSTKLELIYIDDIVKTFVTIMLHGKAEKEDIHYIKPVYVVTLEKLTKMLYSFKSTMDSLEVPQTGDEFTKKLFATYTSYLPLKDISYKMKTHVDQRGSFSELLHTQCSGQVSISTSKPGVVRGNHYHHTKMEKFIVVKGKAKIKLRKIDEIEVFEYLVSEEAIESITMLPGYTHSIENIGEEEMILIIWCNEIFDPLNPDTFYCEV